MMALCGVKPEPLSMTSMAWSRLSRELKLLSSNPPPGITCELRRGTNDTLDATVAGVPGSPYSGMTFRVEIMIPTRYPFLPPSVMFITKIYHPNIEEGRICTNLFPRSSVRGGWSCAMTLENLLVGIRELMIEPNLDEPICPEAAVLWKHYYDDFCKFVREFHQLHNQNETLPSVLDIGVAERPTCSGTNPTFMQEAKTTEATQSSALESEVSPPKVRCRKMDPAKFHPKSSAKKKMIGKDTDSPRSDSDLPAQQNETEVNFSKGSNICVGIFQLDTNTPTNDSDLSEQQKETETDLPKGSSVCGDISQSPMDIDRPRSDSDLLEQQKETGTDLSKGSNVCADVSQTPMKSLSFSHDVNVIPLEVHSLDQMETSCKGPSNDRHSLELSTNPESNQRGSAQNGFTKTEMVTSTAESAASDKEGNML